ncbi:DddA-like double-stranded DNA deaminase toxin [Amycolatopsis sp. cg5]|uniref:DddA-like double-stranded DNA deaminase toxin n=1 Tax=Amycolatopsis sp. cg5 TaxID=3238802 RepID=UPI00352476C5
MSLEDIVRGVTATLRGLPVGTVEAAGRAFQEARDGLAEATRGAHDQDAGQALERLVVAVDEVARVRKTLQMIARELTDYLSAISGGESPSRSGGLPSARTRPVDRRPLGAAELAALRDQLPPAVPKPNPEGKKTYGKWIDAEGNTQQLASGRDADAEEVWSQLQAAGLSASRRPVVADHVEMKLAARMVNSGTTHAEVVLNNRPCLRHEVACVKWMHRYGGPIMSEV